MKTIKTWVHPEFLSKSDEHFMSELIVEYLHEKGISADAFAYSIQVEYAPSEEDES